MSQKSENLSEVVSSPLGTETIEHTHPHDEQAERKPRERKPRQSKTSENDQLERIEGMLRGSAMLTCGIASRISEKDAITIAQHTIAPDVEGSYTPNLIVATMELCKQDKKVRAYLYGLAEQGAYLNVGLACASIAMGIMANHNLLPPMFQLPQQGPKVPVEGMNGVSSVV